MDYNSRYCPLTANNPRLENNLRNKAFFFNLLMRKLGNLLRKQCQKALRSRRVLLRVLFLRRCFRCERRYLKDDKDNKLLSASEICTDSCSWTWSVLEAHSCPRASLSGNCSLLGTDNILGQLSVHISSPKAVYCLHFSAIPQCGVWYAAVPPFRLLRHSSISLLGLFHPTRVCPLAITWLRACASLLYKSELCDYGLYPNDLESVFVIAIALRTVFPYEAGLGTSCPLSPFWGGNIWSNAFWRWFVKIKYILRAGRQTQLSILWEWLSVWCDQSSPMRIPLILFLHWSDKWLRV